MLLTGNHLRALDALQASTAVGQATHAVAEDELGVYRVLELQGLARHATDRSYALTDVGKEAEQLLGEMRSRGLLPPTELLEPKWRFLGSEILAALAAGSRAGGRVGPLTEELLKARGLAQASRAPDTKKEQVRLNSYGTAWLEFALRSRPSLAVTGDLANSIYDMLPAYADPHRLGIPPDHAAQLEAMRLLVWSVPDRDVFTLTALGQAVYEALRKGGYHGADTVLDDAILTGLALLAEKGAGELPTEQLQRLQAAGYVGPDGLLLPAGEAALRARQLHEKEPAGPPATFTIMRHEAELLSVVRDLSEPHFDPTHLSEKPARQTTKQNLHAALVDGLERRYQAFVGKYGRTIEEVPARKRQAQAMVAELRDRDSAYGGLDHLDELLVHLESFELLRAEGEGTVTVYRLTPNGRQVLEEQGNTPHAIAGTAVKAITITTMAGIFYAPLASWIERARAEELIGPSGMTKAGRFYAWLAEFARRWPALTRSEARLLVNLPEAETRRDQGQDDGRRERQDGRDGDEDDDEQARTLDRLEARGLIERLVDGQVVRTEAGQRLERAVVGALELAYPVTPAIVRLLLAVRQVGESLHVKEEKVRIPPHQWAEVERLTGLGPDEFRETVHLARLGKYLGKANLTEAGRDVLEVQEVLTKGNRGA